ncbi:sarcosine dehydrogenase, mitochondrial [Schistocerca americana]|uniref:sarcosine dehydrogenase, mitochondrial n=1 Tax=Schistocerca americana TaxID=7009 RepID=UPI001F4FC6D5|nr:sarcosine dehydrogenase, mitochondrial [Schistocerca americana]
MFLRASKKAFFIPKGSNDFSKLVRCMQNGPPKQKENQKAEEPNVPSAADVVIIGGGSAGCNLLYQLAKRGVDTVLLERSKVTSGTTWHSAGLVWSLRPNDVEIQLLAATRNLLAKLEIETGFNPGWINNGGLYIAHNKERLEEYRRLATVGHSFGIESSILSAEETKKIFPLINEKVVHGSLYSPGDGTVDPSMLCTALTRTAVQAGAKLIENCPVTKILRGKNNFGSKKVSGVITPYGTIRTDCVVNCSGVWSREIASLVNLPIPLLPMKHAYVVSEGIDGVKGLPNVRDHDGSIYFRIQGSSLCMGGYESNPVMLDKVKEDFEFSLYELDWTVFSSHVREAVNLVPVFETAGIKSTVCGPESFTPDHKPLLGEDPRLLGFYHNCGYNSAGMMFGGGCGEQMAQWIINGRPELHMFSYDIRRFRSDQTKDQEWIRERSHESYVMNYSIVFPNDQPLGGRNFRKGPLHDELLNAGVVYEEKQGWERPGYFLQSGVAPVQKYDWFGSYGSSRNPETPYESLLQGDRTFGFSKHHHAIGEECLACREDVALFDMSYLGKLYLSGPDAQLAADWLFSADTRKEVGQSVFTCLLNPHGGVEADVTVSAIETGTGGQADPILKGRGFYIISGGVSAYHTWAHMNSIISLKNFKVALTDHTDKMGVLSVQGPNSRELLQCITNTDLSDSAFPYSTTQLIQLAGHLCRAFRISYVGELGWEIHIPWESCLPIYKAITEQGKKYGLRLAGFRALNSLGCETGYHLWNYDLRSDDLPIECGLDETCRDEGEYVGKAALEVEKRKGLRRRLTFFQLQEQIPVWGLETVWRDGQVVGYLRRGDYGYALGASIGQGYVRHPDGRKITTDFLLNGLYQIEIMGNRYDAVPYIKSPFDPEGKRLQGIYDEPLPIRQ